MEEEILNFEEDIIEEEEKEPYQDELFSLFSQTQNLNDQELFNLFTQQSQNLNDQEKEIFLKPSKPLSFNEKQLLKLSPFNKGLNRVLKSNIKDYIDLFLEKEPEKDQKLTSRSYKSLLKNIQNNEFEDIEDIESLEEEDEEYSQDLNDYLDPNSQSFKGLTQEIESQEIYFKEDLKESEIDYLLDVKYNRNHQKFQLEKQEERNEIREEKIKSSLQFIYSEKNNRKVFKEDIKQLNQIKSYTEINFINFKSEKFYYKVNSKTYTALKVKINYEDEFYFTLYLFQNLNYYLPHPLIWFGNEDIGFWISIYSFYFVLKERNEFIEKYFFYKLLNQIQIPLITKHKIQKLIYTDTNKIKLPFYYLLFYNYTPILTIKDQKEIEERIKLFEKKKKLFNRSTKEETIKKKEEIIKNLTREEAKEIIRVRNGLTKKGKERKTKNPNIILRKEVQRAPERFTPEQYKRIEFISLTLKEQEERLEEEKMEKEFKKPLIKNTSKFKQQKIIDLKEEKIEINYKEENIKTRQEKITSYFNILTVKEPTELIKKREKKENKEEGDQLRITDYFKRSKK